VVYKNGEEYHHGGDYLGIATNNFAEYQGLLMALHYMDWANIKNATIYCDSALVVNQTNQEWDVRNEGFRKMSLKAYGMLVRGRHSLKHVKGHDGNKGNERADQLCNEILDKELNIGNEPVLQVE
jgi:probable phosphoglycerate mutase